MSIIANGVSPADGRHGSVNILVTLGIRWNVTRTRERQRGRGKERDGRTCCLTSAACTHCPHVSRRSYRRGLSWGYRVCVPQVFTALFLSHPRCYTEWLINRENPRRSSPLRPFIIRRRGIPRVCDYPEGALGKTEKTIANDVFIWSSSRGATACDRWRSTKGRRTRSAPRALFLAVQSIVRD